MTVAIAPHDASASSDERHDLSEHLPPDRVVDRDAYHQFMLATAHRHALACVERAMLL